MTFEWEEDKAPLGKMPPKKGKKDVAAKLSDKENLARAETEILSLQRLLELRSHEVGVCARGTSFKTCQASLLKVPCTCVPSPSTVAPSPVFRP